MPRASTGTVKLIGSRWYAKWACRRCKGEGRPKTDVYEKGLIGGRSSSIQDGTADQVGGQPSLPDAPGFIRPVESKSMPTPPPS
jgi:hypothetical protein